MINSLNIVYEDDNILIVNKPIKMLSHPEERISLPDVLSELKQPRYHVITRLDTNTTGLMLLGKTRNVATILSKWMRAGKIHKTYLALCVGYFPKVEDVVDAYLLKDSEKSIMRLSSEPVEGSQKITTEYHVVLEKNQLSLVEINLITGKTHQIRSHLAHLKNPLLGDPLYGNQKMNKTHHQSTQCLASYKIRFEVDHESSDLSYLNGKEFINSSIPFLNIINKR